MIKIPVQLTNADAALLEREAAWRGMGSAALQVVHRSEVDPMSESSAPFYCEKRASGLTAASICVRGASPNRKAALAANPGRRVLPRYSAKAVALPASISACNIISFLQ
jgi:hypothetical protein